eukprot:61981-Prorocentrum_minimum.AAC.1
MCSCVCSITHLGGRELIAALAALEQLLALLLSEGEVEVVAEVFRHQILGMRLADLRDERQLRSPPPEHVRAVVLRRAKQPNMVLGHQSYKVRENIPVSGTNRRRGDRTYP